ncbi:LOW QUALITY PROTEIN: reverse transcriptase [Phytophthora megakarya]|uniref:Reverse transcriptase n=1 Tax=Phytophthora megakarya TaxID=4795 RepID=A0A225W686_9STRA|nr:LOW QUALITY PROTEIN: reverse transcriptase [Phytophthora megakarya]
MRKCLIGKGNALPPAAKGVICDIDLGNTRPVAQRVRTPQRVYDPRVEVTLSVVIVKKNSVDIRLCFDYRFINGLTKLVVYPMPLATDLLEDLVKYRWYCSLHMTSEFGVVPMTDQARLVSAFITPFGLFEWLRMSFDTRDVFKDGIPPKPGTRSVERHLDVCEEWQLSISVGKSEWGISRVDYSVHEGSENGLGAKPNNLEALSKLLPPLYPRIRDLCDRALLPLSRDFEERVTNPDTCDVEKSDYAERAFVTLRSKIAATSMLKHFGADRQLVVIVYATDWAVLTQEHDGVYMPIKFTTRTLKPKELNYNITEKEILVLLCVLNECHKMLVGKTILTLTQHTTYSGLKDCRLSQWAAILSSPANGNPPIGEREGIALAASFTPRAYVDSVLGDITPRKCPYKTAPTPVPKIGPTESLHVISFDESTPVKHEGGAFSAVVWQLPN